MIRMKAGSEFQAAGPATANELSAKRVLVRRVTKIAARRRSQTRITGATTELG